MRSLNVKKERQYSEDGGRGNLPRETGGVPVLTALLMPTAAKKGAFECVELWNYNSWIESFENIAIPEMVFHQQKTKTGRTELSASHLASK